LLWEFPTGISDDTGNVLEIAIKVKVVFSRSFIKVFLSDQRLPSQVYMQPH